MADYAVSGVRYDVDRTLAYRLRVHRVRAGAVDPPMEVLRAHIISAMEFGRSFMAIQLDDRGQYTAYAPIRLVRIEGGCYLRSDGDEVPRDHLQGVAEF